MHECYSPIIAKMIKEKKKIDEKATANSCDSEIIFTMYELWESGELIVPGGNGIEALCKFIYRNFNLPKEKGCKGYLSLSSIKQRVYGLKR